MDIFSLSKDGAYAPGRIIHGIDSVLWVERYATAGEFKIVGDPTPTLMNELAIGNLITHSQTLDVMIVEAHVIDETKDGSPKLEVSGRCLSTVMMENRIVTTNQFGVWAGAATTVPMEFKSYGGNTWYHIIEIIYRTLQQSENGLTENLPKFNVRSLFTENEVPQKERVLKQLSTVAQAVYEMLPTIDAGLKVTRPNVNSFYLNNLEFIVHKGVDLSNTIRFDWNSGDLSKARYVWSDKNFRNGGYTAIEDYAVRQFSISAKSFDTRLMAVDSTDWKDKANSGSLSRKAILIQRIQDELAKHKKTLIVDAEVSSSAKYDYGIDYNIGDRVFVIGRYGAEAVMRVVEHARSVDKENGESSLPTLAPIEQT